MLKIFIFLLIVSCVKTEEFDVFGKLKSGFQMAGKLLGIDRVSEVAQLVSKAFSKAQHDKHEEHGSNVFGSFLRILGFDTSKIGAIAVNTVIFLAQLISSSLNISKAPKLEARYADGNYFDWLMATSKVSDMISQINSKDLPEDLINYIRDRSLDEDTGCIQLLICKISPYIWSMQKALGNNSVTGIRAMFAHLPDYNELKSYGKICEDKHNYCILEY